eukprot:CAMPEP_0201591974 /NCGR_PEP_ID=MMETSP0190_2-20130828/189992_1 /ASSEMBLY_ACC=CAM_ASM_000263 /TAXON_ID=37353 /ORGANISM="Rosalina sp." /LENGTH=607 /DNA_ID=CAMNT_0048050529 /DNA_START=1575 /DNA_END=3399 /DNA_ORIENTATION=+
MYQQHSSNKEMKLAQFESLPVRRRRALDDVLELEEDYKEESGRREYKKLMSDTYSPRGSRERKRDRSYKNAPRPATRSRRRMGSNGGNGSGGGRSFHFVTDTGVDNLVAPDTVYPYDDQCITFNQETLKIFSVGGFNKANGVGMDGISVHDWTGQTQLSVVNDLSTWGLQLNEPRAYGMCQYYKNVFNNNREYIMIINGVKDIKDLSNTDLWYNDIIFIPLDYTERFFNNLPKIQLKHKVIDPTLYVTEANELLDGSNAKNYIQYIDLNVVFQSTSADVLTTMDRFEPMRLNRISPLIDTRILKAGDIYDSCLVIFGGQDFVNNQWIDIEIPPNGLQLYCKQLDSTTAASAIANAEFTSFDLTNLQKVNSFVPPSSTMRTISINKYNFVNDNILYRFTTSHKACFTNDAQIKSIEELFKNSMFQNSLSYNIMVQSQNRFKGWNNGFSTVYGVNINLAKPLEIVADTVNADTLCPGLSELSCHSKVNSMGAALCSYNVYNRTCFAVVPRAGKQGSGTFDDGYDEAEEEANDEIHEIYNLIGILSGAICILIVIIITTFICCSRRKENEETVVGLEETEKLQGMSIDDVGSRGLTGHHTNGPHVKISED